MTEPFARCYIFAIVASAAINIIQFTEGFPFISLCHRWSSHCDCFVAFAFCSRLSTAWVTVYRSVTLILYWVRNQKLKIQDSMHGHVDGHMNSQGRQCTCNLLRLRSNRPPSAATRWPTDTALIPPIPSRPAFKPSSPALVYLPWGRKPPSTSLSEL